MTATRTAWANEMRAIHHEAAGCMDLWPVLYGDMPDLLLCVAEADPTARLILSALRSALIQMGKAPPAEGPLCGCCAASLDMEGMAFCVAIPHGSTDTKRVLAFGICGSCGRDRDTVRRAGTRALCAIWPNARPIAMTHRTGGRA